MLAPQRDEAFLRFLYSKKKEILLLQRRGCADILNSLVLYEFGPKEGESYKYVRYAGAGIWMGVVYAVLDNRFEDSIETIRDNFMTGLITMHMQSNF